MHISRSITKYAWTNMRISPDLARYCHGYSRIMLICRHDWAFRRRRYPVPFPSAPQKKESITCAIFETLFSRRTHHTECASTWKDFTFCDRSILAGRIQHTSPVSLLPEIAASCLQPPPRITRHARMIRDRASSAVSTPDDFANSTQ